MPSPFPGMDPFIEGHEWEDFHTHFIAAIAEHLVPGVRPRYIVRVQRRVYLEHTPEERPMPMPERRQEAFLTIRERESLELVAVIELLSPSNKRPGSDGRREYLGKREAVLLSGTHLVELDLLRGGQRLPTVEPLPPADFYALVSRAARRPVIDVYGWSLRQRLPVIPVPLAGANETVALDLQTIFATVYDRAGYDYSLDYRAALEPPLPEADAVWVQAVLAAAAAPQSGGVGP